MLYVVLGGSREVLGRFSGGSRWCWGGSDGGSRLGIGIVVAHQSKGLPTAVLEHF